MAGRWVDVGEAAQKLGISTDAVRKRISRGSLESDRPNGHVLVWLDESGTRAGQDASDEGRGELVEMLTDQVRYLRSQLDQERQAHAEARRIIGGLVQRVPELETSNLSEAREPDLDADEGATWGDVPRQPQTGAQPPRGFWSRLFGGNG